MATFKLDRIMSDQKRKLQKRNNDFVSQNHSLEQDKPVQKETPKKNTLLSDKTSVVPSKPSAKIQIRIIKNKLLDAKQKDANQQYTGQKKEHVTRPYPFLAESGQILLPKGALPLHVTKPHDILTIKRSLSRNQKIVIVQPKSSELSSEDLYTVGCLGKITTYCENADGSLYVIIKGLQKCHIHEKQGPLVQISFKKAASIKDAHAQKEAIRKNKTPQNLPWEITQKESREQFLDTAMAFLETASLTKSIPELKTDLGEASDEVLVGSLTMACPLEAREKQAILECESTHEQLALLYSFMIMGTYKKCTNFDLFRQERLTHQTTKKVSKPFEKIHSSKSADCFFETQSVNLKYKH